LVFAGFLIRLKPDPKKLLPEFLAGFFQTSTFRTWVQLVSTRTGQPGINGKEYGQLLIPRPDVEEQRAIVAALVDINSALLRLDRLIAKKRDLKQAAMQQLLTGETRLPGFSRAWESAKVGSLLKIRHGRNQSRVESPHGRYPILATGGRIGMATAFLYDKPSVLIGRKGTITEPQYMESPFWSVDTLFYSEIQGENNALFLYYRFRLFDWMQYNEASGVPSLNARTIDAIEFPCPPPAEQTAIAQVLSDMDAEIEALERRRDKTRALKQGMMQELLTGRTRLVEPQPRQSADGAEQSP
jgi:type I restriction enzyme, S subunit